MRELALITGTAILMLGVVPVGSASAEVCNVDAEPPVRNQNNKIVASAEGGCGGNEGIAITLEWKDSLGQWKEGPTASDADTSIEIEANCTTTAQLVEWRTFAYISGDDGIDPDYNPEEGMPGVQLPCLGINP